MGQKAEYNNTPIETIGAKRPKCAPRPKSAHAQAGAYFLVTEHEYDHSSRVELAAVKFQLEADLLNLI